MENEKYKDSVFAAGNLEDELEEILKISEGILDSSKTTIEGCGVFTLFLC